MSTRDIIMIIVETAAYLALATAGAALFAWGIRCIWLWMQVELGVIGEEDDLDL